MATDLEVRPVGAIWPGGEIALRNLTALGSALQELFTRIGRDRIDRGGPGRTPEFMQELTELRLRESGEGSTTLVPSRGPSHTLEFEPPEQSALDARLWNIITAIKVDTPPEGFPT